MAFTPLLSGSKIRLTSMTQNDLPAMVRWHQDPEFLRLLDTRPAAPQAEGWLADHLRDRERSTNAFLFGIRPLESDDLLGFVELEGIQWNQGAGWLVIAVGEPQDQGQGIGSEALELMLDFAFRELNLHRVTLTVFSYNTRAIGVYERAGFQREGVYREYLHRDGRRYDMYLYGILRREWEAVRSQAQRETNEPTSSPNEFGGCYDETR